MVAGDAVAAFPGLLSMIEQIKGIVRHIWHEGIFGNFILSIEIGGL